MVEILKNQFYLLIELKKKICISNTFEKNLTTYTCLISKREKEEKNNTLSLLELIKT